MSHRSRTAAIAAVIALGVAMLPSLPAGAGATASQIRLFAAAKRVSITRYHGERIYVDPGVFVEAVGSAFEIKGQRPAYQQPIQGTQTLHANGSTAELPLPAGTLSPTWQGLAHFVHVTVTDTQGTVVLDTFRPFCPNGWDVQRVDPNSVPTSRYPQFCGGNPFTKGMVWGIEKGGPSTSSTTGHRSRGRMAPTG